MVMKLVRTIVVYQVESDTMPLYKVQMYLYLDSDTNHSESEIINVVADAMEGSGGDAHKIKVEKVDDYK